MTAGGHDARSGFRSSDWRLKAWAAPLVAVVALVIAGAARADVLVNAIEPSTVSCGAAVKLGVWYQSFSAGPRWATIDVENSHGAVVWHKRVTATTTWHYWRYFGHCGVHYTAVYRTAGGTSRFPFSIR
jgi:hypothetical protein